MFARRIKEDSFVCSKCSEEFLAPVWHCPFCDHHWSPKRRSCWNCHKKGARKRADTEAKAK